MNHVTNIRVRSEPNGALTISNDDGDITIQPDGTVAISTVAPIQLTGDSLGKLDSQAVGGTSLATEVRGFLNLLQRRGTKKG